MRDIPQRADGNGQECDLTNVPKCRERRDRRRGQSTRNDGTGGEERTAGRTEVLADGRPSDETRFEGELVVIERVGDEVLALVEDRNGSVDEDV